MKKFLSFVLGLILLILLGKVVLWGMKGSESNNINYLLPDNFSGVIILHGSNTVVHPTEGRRVIVRIDTKGQGTINRKYLTSWHATSFSEGTTLVPEWIEMGYPADTKKRAFSIRSLNLKLFPADMSDAYFIGTGNQFKDFLKTHPEDN